MTSERTAWGIKFESDNRLDGHREYLGGGCRIDRPDAFGGYTTMVFRTRATARKFIAEQYTYFTRPDLRTEPHGWKMPRPVRVRILVEEHNA